MNHLSRKNSITSGNPKAVKQFLKKNPSTQELIKDSIRHMKFIGKSEHTQVTIFGNGRVEHINISEELKDFKEIENSFKEAMNDAKKQMKSNELREKLKIEAEKKIIENYKKNGEEELLQNFEKAKKMEEAITLQLFAKCALMKCKNVPPTSRLNCQQECFKTVKLSTCLKKCHTSKTKKQRIQCRKTCFNTKATTKQATKFINYILNRSKFLMKKHKKFVKSLKQKKKILKAKKKICWTKCSKSHQKCFGSRVQCAKKFYVCSKKCHSLGKLHLIFLPFSKYKNMIKKRMKFLKLHPKYKKKLLKTLKTMKRKMFVKKCFMRNGQRKCCVFIKTFIGGKLVNTKARCSH
eukprot:gene4753-8335_t